MVSKALHGDPASGVVVVGGLDAAVPPLSIPGAVLADLAGALAGFGAAAAACVPAAIRQHPLPPANPFSVLRAAVTERDWLNDVGLIARPEPREQGVVTARLLRPSDRDARAWDAFAKACDHASFVGSLGYARLYAGTGGLATAEIMLREGARERKIGQATIVGPRRGERHIVDGIKLLPDRAALWPEAVLALLRLLGPGRWRYGSTWSGEPPRADALAALPGVAVRTVRRSSIYEIDFTRWPDWDDYIRGLNSNVRRNLRKGAALPDLRVEVGTGWRAARKVFLLDAMRRATLRRKGVADHPSLRRWPRSAIRFLLRVAALGDGVTVAVARTGGKARAVFSGVEFGSSTFYLDGGSAGVNDGVSWHLLAAMIERSYRRNPRGCFVMGHEEDANRTGTGWDNLVRSRLQCQAERVPSDEVCFDYVSSDIRNRSFRNLGAGMGLRWCRSGRLEDVLAQQVVAGASVHGPLQQL